MWARAPSPRRATKLALRDGPDVVVAATKRPISVAPIGREARFGSERSRPRVPRLESRRESFDKVCEAHAFALLLSDTRLLLHWARHEARLTGRQGAPDGRDVREAAIPHARGGGHRCARAPGRAHAERDGRSEATLPASKDPASFLFKRPRLGVSRKCFQRTFFFIRGAL